MCVNWYWQRKQKSRPPDLPGSKNIVYFQETLELEYMIEMIEEALIVLCMFQQESFRLMFLIAPVNNDRVGRREIGFYEQ